MSSASGILNQSWQNIELIIVDDCSTDGTWSCMQSLASADNRVRLIRNKVNVGPYVSKNRAVGIAKGKYLTGHDADDWAHPQRIERHLKEMLRRPSVKASLAKMVRVDIDGRVAQFTKQGKTSSDGVSRLASIACMFEMDFFKKYFGHWDVVRFGADSELIERARTILGDRFETKGRLCDT